MTRSQVARMLACSKSTVRRMEESGELTPVVVDDVHLFAPEQVKELAARRGHGIAAAAFQLFAQGRSAIEVVIELNADPKAVEELFQTYHRLDRNWVIEGPGSIHVWQDIYKLGELTPKKLRRCLEIVAADPKLRPLLDMLMDVPSLDREMAKPDYLAKDVERRAEETAQASSSRDSAG